MPLPPAVEELNRLLKDYGKRNREKLLERVKWRTKRRVLEVLCFLRAYGLAGLERWAIAKLSPRRGLRGWRCGARTLRLYRASRRRQAMKGGACGVGVFRRGPNPRDLIPEFIAGSGRSDPANEDDGCRPRAGLKTESLAWSVNRLLPNKTTFV